MYNPKLFLMSNRALQQALSLILIITLMSVYPGLSVSASAETSSAPTKVAAKVLGSFKVGDSYTYRVVDLLTKVESGTFTQTVTGVTNAEVIYDDGKTVRDLLGNILKNRSEFRIDGKRSYVGEYSVGKTWVSPYSGVWRRPNGSVVESDGEMTFKVLGKERITVPAGTFETFKVEGDGGFRIGASLKVTYWIAPEQVALVIAQETTIRNSGIYLVTDREELVSYKQ